MAILCFSGCGEKEILPENPGVQPPGESVKPEEPEGPEEPENSMKGKSICFTLAGKSWETGDKVKIYSVTSNASGTKMVKSAVYYVTPDSSDPTKCTLAVQLGLLDLRWHNDDEHTFYAVYSKGNVNALSVDGDGKINLSADAWQICNVTNDGTGNYTASMDAKSSDMFATASADPQDVAAQESASVSLAFSSAMTALDIVIEGPSSGEAVITAISITAETASTDELVHKFVYDIGESSMVDADMAPDTDNPRRVSTLLSIANSETDNPNSVKLTAGKTLKVSCLIPPIATDKNRTLTIRPHSAGYGSTQIAHKAGAGTASPIVPGSHNTVNISYNNSSDVVASNAWMTYLDDNLRVSQLSIPGTHDAATENLSLGQCQSLSIEEQLDMGIRMFDLRPTVGSSGLGNICHSVLDTGVSMGDVMTWFGNYLTENPDEFVVAVMRWESEKGGTEDNFKKYMTEFLAGNSVYQTRKTAFKPGLTLGECRGKILLVSRTNLSPNSTYETAYTGWNHSNTIYGPHDIYGTKGSGKIRVQDMYAKGENGNSSDDEYLVKKRELVKGMMDLSAKYHTSNSSEWMINHCSGYTGSSWSPNYKNNAANVHPEVYSYLTGMTKTVGPAGIIVMDFVGSRKTGSTTVYGDLLPQAVIDNNFKY